MSRESLNQLLDRSAAEHAGRTAAVEPGLGSIRYDDLNRLSSEIGALLATKGVSRGDRVGLHVPKSIAALASIFGILKTGAAYVPVDSSAPPARNHFIFSDCSVKYVISRNPEGTGFGAKISQRHPLESIDPALAGLYLVAGPPDAPPGGQAIPDGLAYILYTSGSTGQPKGVMLTHANALAFIDWCSTTFVPQSSDHFSSHAPFHFDLSILDVYLSIKHGSRLVLISEETGRQPKQLASLIEEQRISIWYSTPTILKLLLDVKGIEQYDHSSLHSVLFAGEVFPVKQLRALQALWPGRRYYNLYGPTETNVCTFFPLPEGFPDEAAEAVPIGKPCSGDSAIVTDESGDPVNCGSEGELCVTGPSVTSGYWKQPERNAAAFFEDAEGTRWYKTGDIVREDDRGDYHYIGRRDRMIKRRGYRVELGEIEATLYRHDAITEAAVVALQEQANGISVTAFISWSGVERPSIIALKRFCMENLPGYMIPDRFSILPSLPKTSTDKVDYRRLRELA